MRIVLPPGVTHPDLASAPEASPEAPPNIIAARIVSFGVGENESGERRLILAFVSDGGPLTVAIPPGDLVGPFSLLAHLAAGPKPEPEPAASPSLVLPGGE